ncbi:MAG: PqqD family protein, partial [Anaerolineae bacterium]|nr:PqqD family protein [Anaerolineae bacterium]
QTPVRNPAVIFQAVFDDAVLVNADTGVSLVLNPTGVIVWQSIDGRRGLTEIVAELMQHYPDAPEANVVQDVAALLETLAEDGFIGYEVLGGPPAGSS